MTGVTWKSPYDLWDRGYPRRNSRYCFDGTDDDENPTTLKSVYDSYEHAVSINVFDYDDPDELYKAELFCKEHFGEMNEYDPTVRWNVCSNEVRFTDMGVTNLIPILTFLFHNADDAMAFKLRWV